MMNNKSSARISKWIWRIQQLDFVVQHQAGKLAEVPDALSRQPLESTNPYSQKDLEELYSGSECKPFDPFIKKATPLTISAMTTRAGRTNKAPVNDSKIKDKEDGGTKKRRKKIQDDGRQDKEPADGVKDMTEVKDDEDLNVVPPADGWDLQVWLREQNNEKNKQVFAQINDFKKNQRGPFKINSDGLLVRLSKAKNGDKDIEVEKVYVPESLRDFVFTVHHDMPLGGAHMGRNRLLKAVGSRYYWPAMDEELRSRVRGCLGCAKRKTTRNMNLGLTGPAQADAPWDVVGIDLIGEFLETDRGNKYVLTMVDHFTKWPIAIAIPDRKAETIARVIFEHLICEHGIPRRILSDRGQELISEVLKILYEKWGVRRVATGGYNPQANGVCERFHRYLNASMTQLYDKKSPNWDNCVPAAVFAYRVSDNDTTGYSPYFLQTGREARLPADNVFSPKGDKEDKDFVETMVSALKRAFDETRKQQYARFVENVVRRPDRQKPKFVKGDLVLLWARTSKESRLDIKDDKRAIPRKWVNPWKGPGVFEQKLTETQAEIMMEGKLTSVNYNRLARYVPWNHVRINDGKWSNNDSSESKNRAIALKHAERDVLVGDTILFELGQGSDEHGQVSFGVGLVLDTTTEFLKFQWLGSYKYKETDKFKPGWIDPKDRKVYYNDKKTKSSHVRYENDENEVFLKQKDLLLWGDEVLDSKNRLSNSAKESLRKARKDE